MMKTLKFSEDMPIEKMDLSVRTYLCLKRHGISTLGELSKMTAKKLMIVRNLGKSNYDEILEKLGTMGIVLPLDGE